MPTKFKGLVETLYSLDNFNKSEIPCRMIHPSENCPNEPLFRVFMTVPCACIGGGVESCLPHKEDIMPYFNDDWIWECDVCGVDNGPILKIERI